MPTYPDTKSAATLEEKIALLRRTGYLAVELRQALWHYEANELTDAMAIFENENYHDVCGLIAERIKATAPAAWPKRPVDKHWHAMLASLDAAISAGDRVQNDLRTLRETLTEV